VRECIRESRPAGAIIASNSSPGSSSASSPPSASRSGGRESSEILIRSSPLAKRPPGPYVVLVLPGYEGSAYRRVPSPWIRAGSTRSVIAIGVAFGEEAEADADAEHPDVLAHRRTGRCRPHAVRLVHG